MARCDLLVATMRACEADRCDAGATVGGRWCERHVPADERVHRLVEIQHDANGDPFIEAQMTRADVTPGFAVTSAELETPASLAPEPDPVADAALERRRDELVRWWEGAAEEMAEATNRLEHARARRVEVLDDMRRTGMSLGDIAEVTGLTRQRIGQLLR